MTTIDWYKIVDSDKLDSPSLVVYPQRVVANIQLAISMTGDASCLRPHAKTNKSPDVTRLMMQAGIQKFKCATIAEAEMLASCDAKDIVLAYQPIGPKVKRFVQLIKKFPATRFACLADNLQAAKEQAAVFAANDLIVPVYLDLNTGMSRSGIVPGDQAIELYTFLSTGSGVQAAGLHVYDGHIRDTDMTVRTARCNEAFALAEKLKAMLEEKKLQIPDIIVGGSPTFPIHAKRKNVECSPGTFVYWDKGYSDACPEQEFLPAAVLVTRIVSLPTPTSVCTDLGHKSVAAENEITRRVYFLNAAGLQSTGQSEEHLILEAGPGHSFKIGDILYGLPYHICPTIALYERVYTIEDGKVSGEWKNSARDRVISI